MILGVASIGYGGVSHRSRFQGLPAPTTLVVPYRAKGYAQRYCRKSSAVMSLLVREWGELGNGDNEGGSKK